MARALLVAKPKAKKQAQSRPARGVPRPTQTAGLPPYLGGQPTDGPLPLWARAAFSPPDGADTVLVSTPADPLEREADALGERVMAMTEPRAPGPLPTTRPQLPDAGASLSAEERGFFEPRFGVDLGAVEVHAGADAAAAAAAVDARAYTIGNHVVVGAGEQRSGPAGRRLLAHELAHVVQHTGGRTPPANVVARQPDPRADDPQARLGTSAARRWEALYKEIGGLMGELAKAEQVSPSVTRKAFLNELTVLMGRLGEVSEDAALPPIEAAYQKWHDRMIDTGQAADEKWSVVDERAQKELARLGAITSMAGIYAYRYLSDRHGTTKKKIAQINNDQRVTDDFLTLQSELDADTHIWYGELRAARERVAELEQMLRVVDTLRRQGQDDDKLVPGWFDRASAETSRLSLLARNATKRDYRVAFEGLEKQLRERQYDTYRAKPPSKGVLEKGYEFVKGALSAVIDPLVEATKQVVDLGQIALHFVSFTHYEPKFISDTAKAAEKGATTKELLKGMVTHLLETPKRLWNALEKGDWEAIGRETAQLYLLAKTGKDGAALAARWLPLVRARMAGLRGGMGGAAALEVLKVAKAEGVVIRFRMTEAPSVRLLERGHPPKPEYLKMKTIRDLDTHLGASSADIGKVGFFKPRLPDNLGRLDAALQSKIRQRFNGRMEEWHSYREQVRSLEAQGVIEHRGPVIVDKQSGKAFTGDYDLFDIRRGTSAGESLEFGSLSGKAQRSLKDKPVEVQHGAHLDWKEIPAGYAEGYAKIILEARPTANAKPLIEFHPDGRIRYTYFTD
jgi:hypothetical protein